MFNEQQKEIERVFNSGVLHQKLHYKVKSHSQIYDFNSDTIKYIINCINEYTTIPVPVTKKVYYFLRDGDNVYINYDEYMRETGLKLMEENE